MKNVLWLIARIVAFQEVLSDWLFLLWSIASRIIFACCGPRGWVIGGLYSLFDTQ